MPDDLRALQLRFETAWQRFMQTDDAQEYLKLRNEFLRLADDSHDAQEVHFAAVSAAAECLFFVRQGHQDPAVRRAILMDLLKMFMIAAREAQPHYVQFSRFLSVLRAVLADAFDEQWSGFEAAAATVLLKNIAGQIEARLPLSPLPGRDLSDRLSYVETFAGLSIRFGSADMALLRLRSAVDSTRQNYRSRAGRLWCAQIANGELAGLVADAKRSKRVPPAQLFEAAELLKSRLLLDQLGGFEKPLPPDPRMRELERAALRFKPADSDDEDNAEWRLTSQMSVGWVFDDRKAMVEHIEEHYRQAQLGLDGCAPVAALSDIQAALERGEALIEYFIPAHGTHPAKELLAIAITADAVAVVPLPLDALPAPGLTGSMSFDGRAPLAVSALGNAVWSMRRALLEGDDQLADQWLVRLWQTLVFPLLNRWGYPDESRRWIIVPHGPLHYVPFAALPDAGGTRLIEEVALTLAPSASVWLALRRRQRPPLKRFLGIADPSLEDSELPPLEQARTELAAAIKSVAGLKTQRLCADLATEHAVRTAIPGAGIVHFATHGEFPEQDPFDFHRILLAADDDHDGRLHADELRDMDLTAARLVVLSICDGGLYRFGPGDEPLGLIPALFAAGTENVLAPLWQIEDTATRRFMAVFYKNLLKQGPAQAWRLACKAAIKKGTELRDWAGFINTGSGAALTRPRSSRADARKPRKRARSHRPGRARRRAP